MCPSSVQHIFVHSCFSHFSFAQSQQPAPCPQKPNPTQQKLLHQARLRSFVTMDDDFSMASAEADREMTRLWRTWRTVFEMLLDRVYLKTVAWEIRIANSSIAGL